MLGGVARDLIILKQRSWSNLVRSYGAEENPFSLSPSFTPLPPPLASPSHPHDPSPRHRQAETRRNRRPE